MIRRTLIAAGAWLALSAAAAAAPVNPPADGPEFLARVGAAVAGGEITPEQALYYKFAYGFAPQALPDAWRPVVRTPLKCGTEMIREFESRRATLPVDMVKAVDAWLAPPQPAADKATYNSPGGHFTLTYYTTGANAVPTADTSPANGIPDYVEKVASYCDYSWTYEIDTLGFPAPPIGTGRYQIGFESMGYYGYTSPLASPAGATRITLHNTFLGFPPNTDPEGNQWGAAKVTVAHEFKHASQRAGSLWSEGDWVELDATWMEDAAYDQVNDFYNYLPSGSPISSPATPLDGAGGGGSYEDCIWQHWMTETYGNPIIVDLWDWRRTHQAQAMIDSYAQVLADYGSSLAAAWPVFAAWNYATGTRAAAGFGYGEAAAFPTGPVTTLSSYPGSASGAVSRLAAAFVRCANLAGGLGQARLVFDGADGTQVQCTAVITRTDGTAVYERLALDGANDADALLSVPLAQIAALGVVVSNGATGGVAQAWSLTVDRALPAPALVVDPAAVSATATAGGTAGETVAVTNSGEAGSVLHFTALVMESLPARARPRSIAGATLAASPASYTPGTTGTLTLTVTNPSTDQEWLTTVTVDFPPGITVTGSTDFVGGTDGPLVTSAATGDGAVVTWSDANGGWGNVYGNGQQATATVNVAFAAGLSGAQNLAWTIVGDQYGATPHSVSGTTTLAGPAGPSLTLISPAGGELWAVGSTQGLSWTSTGGVGDVRVDVSRDGGSSWETAIASTPNDGSEGWTVTGPATGQALVRVASLAGDASDVCDGPLTLYQPVDWVTATPAGGAVAAGASQPLSLAFDAASLSPGTYGAVLVIDSDAAGGLRTVPLSLTVETDLTGVDDLPAVLVLDGNHPNPFNPATTIAFALPAAGRVEVGVYDAQGRLIRTLWRGELPAGRNALAWDGRDDLGRAVASGAYLARVRAGGTVATAKMTLAR